MFNMDGDNPRLVIDFPQSIYYGKNSISLTDSVLASSIRIGLHQTPVLRTRVVIDLVKDRPVTYSSDYAQEDNILTIALASDSTEPQPEATHGLQVESKVPAPQVEQTKVQKTAEQPKAVVTGPPAKQQPLQPVVKGSTESTEQKPLGKVNLPVAEEKAVVTAPPVKKEPQEEPSEPVAQKKDDSGKPKLLDVSFDDSSSKGEMVLFRLNDFYPPTVSAIEKDTPRVLCDFLAMDLGPEVQPTILANGKYIERIRTAIHHDPESVRVVLDLSPDRDYDLQQVFFRNDNLFVLIVNELAPDQKAQ